MLEMNYLAIAVSAIAAFVASIAYYIVFSKQRAKLSSAAVAQTNRPQPSKMVAEIVRNLILSFVLAYFIQHLGVTTWMGAVHLGLVLWIGFPVILLTGSVMWENVSWKLAAIHMGDWLIKLLLITGIVGLWR
jgi:glycerol uptake facilitator-like aquaporin